MSKQSIREILEYFGREDLLPPIPGKPIRRKKPRSQKMGKWKKAWVECAKIGIVYYRNPPPGTPERTGWNPRLYRRGWWLEGEDGSEYLGLTAIEALRRYHGKTGLKKGPQE